VRNLTHDENHADPRPINPGEHRTVRIALNDIAQRFAKGHRIRVAISTSYWPLAWPSPEHVKLKVFTGECRLTLPIRPPDPKDADVTFEEPEAARPYDVTQIGTEDHNWHVVFDLAEDRHTLVVTDDSGLVYLPDSELVYGDRVVETYSSVADDFESIAAQTHAQRSLERGEWRIAMDTRMSVTSDKDNFYLDAELDAWEGSTRIFSRNWSRSIPRRCV
jgi:hypothetical protein